MSVNMQCYVGPYLKLTKISEEEWYKAIEIVWEFEPIVSTTIEKDGEEILIPNCELSNVTRKMMFDSDVEDCFEPLDANTIRWESGKFNLLVQPLVNRLKNVRAEVQWGVVVYWS